MIAPGKIRELKQLLSEKDAAEAVRLMTDFESPNVTQIRNVGTAINLAKNLTARKPTQVEQRAKNLFEDAETIAGTFADVTEGKPVPEYCFTHAFLLWMWIVLIYADHRRFALPNSERLRRQLKRITAERPERQSSKDSSGHDKTAFQLIRKYFTPQPRWWTPKIDDLLTQNRPATDADGRTDQQLAKYFETCDRALIDNPGFLDQHKKLNPEKWRAHDERQQAERRALAVRMRTNGLPVSFKTEEVST